MKWSEILNTLEKNVTFYRDKNSVNYMIRRQLEIGQRVSTIIPEVNSVFATGYPWYAVGNSMHHTKIDEIWRHTSEFLNYASKTFPPSEDYNLIEEFEKNANGKSITQYFEGNDAKILPHDIFETLYDFDFFFVVDGDVDVIGPKIWDLLLGMGLFPVERNPVRIIKEYPNVIPVDANVVSVDNFLDNLKSFSHHTDSAWVKHKTNALIDWGGGRQRDWWFGLDMITELSELHLTKDILDALSEARATFSKNRTYQEILFDIHSVAESTKHSHFLRKSRLLKDPYIRDAVSNRFEKLFIDLECETNWYRELYTEPVHNKEDYDLSIISLLNKEKSELEKTLLEMREIPSDKQLTEIIIPVAFYLLNPYLRHLAVQVLIRVGNNSNYSLNPLLKEVLRYEHSEQVKKDLKQYIKLEEESTIQRFDLLSSDNIKEIIDSRKNITHSLVIDKYKSQILPYKIRTLSQLEKQYAKYYDREEGGYSFNTVLEDTFRFQHVAGINSKTLTAEVLKSSNVHETVKEYITSLTKEE